jgi:nucleoside-diphosphate-sugar epimerase
MRILPAGASGVVGRRLAGLLRDANHEVFGTTRTPAKTQMLRVLGVAPALTTARSNRSSRPAISRGKR